MDKIKYPSKIDNWKTFEENYNTIAFNVLYIKEMEICTAHISKINSNCAKKKKKNLYNDPKQRKRHLALSCSKRLPALLRGTTSKKRWLLLFELSSFI